MRVCIKNIMVKFCKFIDINYSIFLFIATLFRKVGRVCRCGFRLPSGAGRVGSGCPPYLSGVFCVAWERQPENFVSWFSGCLVLRRNGLQAVCFFVFFFYEHAHVVNFRYCFV